MAKRTSKKTILTVLMVLLFLGLTASTVYLYLDNKDLKAELALSEQERLQKQNDKLLAEVGKLINLPEGEPIIVLVNDPAKAEEENPGIGEIFADLQKEDYIIIFKADKLGIHYRPSERKIIASKTVSLPIVVEVVGSQTAIDETIEQLAQFGNQLTFIQTVNNDVEKSGIYDVDNNQSNEVQSIDQVLNVGVTTTLPNNVVPNEQAEIVLMIADDGSTGTDTTTQP